MMKYSHVIACPPEECSLGYSKIVFDNGYWANVGKLHATPPCMVRDYRIRTSVSLQDFTEYDNGDSVCNCEWWLVGRKDGKLVIKYTSHGNIDVNGNYYSKSEIFETANLNWFENPRG